MREDRHHVWRPPAKRRGVSVPEATGVDLGRRLAGPVGERLRVLLVEDDPTDAFLVREWLAEVAAPIDLLAVESMREARPLLSQVQCVLLDLGLSDASGLDGLREVLRRADGVAVCVLTGLQDEHL